MVCGSRRNPETAGIPNRAAKPPSELALWFELQREIQAGFSVKKSKLAEYARMVVGERSPVIANYIAELILGKPRKKGAPQEYWVERERAVLARIVWYRHADLKAAGERDPYNAAIEQVSDESHVPFGTLKRWYNKYRPSQSVDDLIQELARDTREP